MSRRQQFFHGTSSHEFQPGEKVLPATVAGVPSRTGGSWAAWASDDPLVAKTYAGEHGAVYRVTPDTEIKKQDRDYFAAPSWTVQARAWDPSRQDTERIARFRTGTLRQMQLKRRRTQRVQAYERDSRLNPQEQEAADQVKMSMDPAYAEKRRQTDDILRML